MASFCNKTGLACRSSNIWIAGVGVKASLERADLTKHLGLFLRAYESG